MQLSDIVSFTNPLNLPWGHLGLEVVVYLCFALTLRHALSAHRRGEGYHLFKWCALFVYGLVMELVSFNFFDNYEHATFTVQFYYGQLPLYVTCIYMVFHYTGIKLVERLRLPRLQEGLMAGLAIMAIDVPFDTLGVDAGWWIWRDNSAVAIHPRLIEAVSTRFYNVPVSSYYWYLMYGALLAIFCRVAFPWVQTKGWAKRLAMSVVVAVAVFVAGAAAFELLFWTPARLGVGHGTSVLVYLVVVWLYALTLRAPNAQPVPRWVVVNLVAFYSFHAVLLAFLWGGGSLVSAPAKLGLALAAGTGLVLITWVLPLRRAHSAPVAAGKEGRSAAADLAKQPQ